MPYLEQRKRIKYVSSLSCCLFLVFRLEYFTFRHKKSGTALLLLRYLRLWYCLNIRTATPKPTPICTYARVPNNIVRYGLMNLHIPRTSKCCHVLDVREFTRFQVAKHKAIMTPYYVCNFPPNRHNPKAWAYYECKGSDIFPYIQILRRKSLKKLNFLIFCTIIRVDTDFILNDNL